MRKRVGHFVVPMSVSRLLMYRSSTAALVVTVSLMGFPVRAGAPNDGAQAPLVIWDDQPADKWDTAYPVGNGRLGAMPQGMFPHEKILINEETIWARRDTFGMPVDSFGHLERVRELEAAGDYSGADQYFEQHLEDGQDPCSYQFLDWLHLEYNDTARVKQLRRELDLQTGIAKNVYTLDDGTEITQGVFVSSPDDVIAVMISANRPISVKVSLDKGVIENGEIVLNGAGAGENATQYVGRVRAFPVERTEPVGEVLEIKDSKEVTIYLSVATDFDRRNSRAMLPDGWQAKALSDLDRLQGRSPADVQTAAVRDHGQYFNRMDVDFGQSPQDILALPTRDRLNRIKQGKTDDPDLIETYFQFGRYLLIASSRPGCFPANLQGVWNPHRSAPWGADYHLNINVQMNYWPAEMLLHSHNDEIKLLPALPDQWPDGHVRGLRARGDYTVDIQWKNRTLSSATIHAGEKAVSGKVPVTYKHTTREISVTPGHSAGLSLMAFHSIR